MQHSSLLKIFSSPQRIRKDYKAKLAAQFEVKDLGDLEYILGVWTYILV